MPCRRRFPDRHAARTQRVSRPRCRRRRVCTADAAAAAGGTFRVVIVVVGVVPKFPVVYSPETQVSSLYNVISG